MSAPSAAGGKKPIRVRLLFGVLPLFSNFVRFVERHHGLHAALLKIWRLFPARLAGFLKGLLARSWVVGAVAVMIDESVSPPEVVLAKHSYRRRGAWGFLGGSLESVPGDPKEPRAQSGRKNIIADTLRREIREELGMEVDVHEMIKVDAVPYMPEEPGPYRLNFYFRCEPAGGFDAFRGALGRQEIKPQSPEIETIRLVPLPEATSYDLFATDAYVLSEDLARLPSQGVPENRALSAGEAG